MSVPLICAFIWVLVATVVAFMPLRLQYLPGLALSLIAPPLIAWIGLQHSFWIALAAILAFVSVFRNPLRYYWRKWRGQLA